MKRRERVHANEFVHASDIPWYSGSTAGLLSDDFGSIPDGDDYFLYDHDDGDNPCSVSVATPRSIMVVSQRVIEDFGSIPDGGGSFFKRSKRHHTLFIPTLWDRKRPILYTYTGDRVYQTTPRLS